ncbi:hypothetical protein HELRODRAFT_146123, partial [Helobdella robusta]|uniref:SH2 domain-containing protein n=1 Tax=Helobdella robusta TaxID=6412 RepID=T1EJQ4_HELRO
WFHGLLSRQEAELLLRDSVEGSYLVRISESNNKDYSLSLSDSGYLHIKIIISCDDMFILGQFSQPFVSVASIIEFFASNKLPIKGTRHILLSHPI